MGTRLHGCVLVRHRGRQAHIRVCSSPGRSETSGWRDRPQLKLRVPELPSHPEERVLPALQGKVERQQREKALAPPSSPNINFVSFAATATSLLGIDRFTHYVTGASLNLFVNAGEIFANDAEADHQKTANDEFQQNYCCETGESSAS